MIQLETITHRFPSGVTALRDVHLRILPGETLAIIGRSGSGKSTLLRTMNGLITPTHGTVLIDGAPLNYADLPPLRRRMGYVIQDAGLFPHLSVAENIGLVATLEYWPATRIIDRFRQVMQLVGLPPEQFAAKYPHALSGGEAQRVGIARALMCDPPILLMDEPFSALDPITRRDLQQEFARIKMQIHKTIVLITHHMEEAFALGDRVALMENGAILQIGTPQDLAHSPATAHVARFLEGQRV